MTSYNILNQLRYTFKQGDFDKKLVCIGFPCKLIFYFTVNYNIITSYVNEVTVYMYKFI